MGLRHLVVSLAAGAALACAHASSPAKPPVQERSPDALSWYRLPRGQFSVLMPPGATAQEKSAMVSGDPVPIHIVEAAPAGTGLSYLVSVAELPADVLQKTSTAALLDGVQNGALREVGGTLLWSREIVVDGMPGREFAARKAGEGGYGGRVVAGKDAIFTMIGTYPGAQPPESIVRFLSSLSAARTPTAQGGSTGSR